MALAAATSREVTIPTRSLPFGIRLGEPVVSYCDPAGPASSAPTAASRDSDGLHWSDGRVSVRAAVGAPLEQWQTIDVEARLERESRLTLLAVTFEVRCSRAPLALSRDLRWSAVAAETDIPELTPLVIRWTDEADRYFELRAAGGGSPCRISWRPPVMRAEFALDAAALHPRYSDAAGPRRSRSSPLRPAGERLVLRLLARAAPEAERGRPVAAARLPRGARAAFVITDHSDFDTTARMEAFLTGAESGGGWLGRGLRLSKGVFTVPSTLSSRKPAATLADSAYRRLALQLHDDGSEIAPHGLNESGQLSPAEFRAALASISRDFQPRTWIDHGKSLRYCYSMEGGTNPEFRLLDALRDHGFSTLWSHYDLPSDPATGLNLLDPVLSGVTASAGRLIGNCLRGRPLVGLHQARTAVLNRLPGNAGEALSAVLFGTRRLAHNLRTGPVKLRASLAEFDRFLARAYQSLRKDGDEGPWSTHELVRRFAPIVYPERAVPLSQGSPDDMLLFTSQDVTHLAGMYSPRALDDLADQRGVHVGHCYLLNRVRYLAGVFRPGTGKALLAEQWIEFVEGLEARVRRGEIWNPVMSEMAEWFRDWQQIELLPVDRQSVLLRNPGKRAAVDFTLLLPQDVKAQSVQWGDGPAAGSVSWDDALAVWGRLPPETTTTVRWAL